MYVKEEIITIASDLIRFRSTKKNEKARKEVIGYVRCFFEKENVYIKEFEKNGVYSIVITLKKEKTPFLFLSGHLDVVSAKKEDFLPKVKGNRLYGRGSGDMKGGVAVMMMIMRDLSRMKKKSSVGFMLTTDEEVGGENGAGYLVNTKGYRSEFLIVPDGGTDLNEIILNQKGILHLKVKAYGKLSHGARPFLGENAIEKLIGYYQKIQKIVPPLTKPEWKNSVNLGKIEGGKNANSVPDHAEMLLDIRLIKKGEKERIYKKVKKITEGNIEIIGEGKPFIQSEKHPLVKKYLKIASEEMKKDIKLTRVEGASDARYFSANGIPTIITKINCENIHSDNEWFDLIQAKKFYTIVMRLVEKMKI